MAATPYGTISAKPPPRHRGGGDYPPSKFNIQSMDMTWAWGCEPASATVKYIGSSPVSTGAAVILKVAGHTFNGICKSDHTSDGSDGLTRELRFVDNRDYLDFDLVYCAFNKPDDRTVNGRRVRRYRHILPADSNARIWTYTNGPLTAAQMLDYIFNADTVEDNWTRVYHADQAENIAILDIDALQGKKLKAIIQEISDRQGLVFTLMGGPYRLVWARKGEGAEVEIPEAVNNVGSGQILSGHPTRIRILGDRNLYQVSNIPMVADWKTAWSAFYDVSLLTEEIYRIGTTRSAINLGGTVIPAGTQFSSIDSAVDPERIVGHQLALAESLEITVAEFAALKGDGGFNDYRKFTGRSRMEMPAALYISQILFRAFRFQSGFTVKNFYGAAVPLGSLSIAGKTLAAVSHDPGTGNMIFDLDEAPASNGYAIVQGYQVGKDMFRTIRPDRFNVSQWTDAQSVWEHIEFQVDDAGEEDGWYILFDEPVIKSENLVTMVDGHAVFNAAPTFTTPPVRVCLTFEGEAFSYVAGTGTRDEVENVSGLCGEFVSVHGGAPEEIEFEDGQTATQKAAAIATSLLNNQFAYARGQYVRFPNPESNGQFAAGTQLTGMIDRVTLNISATGGCTEVTDLTAERPRTNYIPERDLERSVKFKSLLPGQAQLREEANNARLIAAALQSSPQARRTVSDAFHGIIGSNEVTHRVRLDV